MKLAVVTTHPIQYQAPIWRLLAAAPDLHVRVYFGSDFSVRGYQDSGFGVQVNWDVPLTEGYDHEFLSTSPTIQSTADLRLNRHDFRQRLGRFGPSCALINGYAPVGFYGRALWTLRRNGIPVMFRAEATDEALTRSRPKQLVRNLYLRAWYSQISAVYAIGENARQHFLAKGIGPERIFWSPYAVDSELFEQQYQLWSPQRAIIRQELGFDDDTTVWLFSGKLVPEKDPLVLIEAFKILSGRETGRHTLLVVGDGPLRETMQASSALLPQGLVQYVGFKLQRELGRYYTAADALLMTSRSETWGLVVNESLQFGKPAIVSNRVGCHPDLITPGETGFVFPVGDAAELADYMVRMASVLTVRRSAVAAACRERAAAYSSERAAQGIVDTLRTVCGERRTAQES
jgi:glycosyltransferase involved in cell wall biosynthesis